LFVSGYFFSSCVWLKKYFPQFGFDLFKGIRAVSSSNAYTNFLKLLVRESDSVDVMFYSQVKKLSKLRSLVQPAA